MQRVVEGTYPAEEARRDGSVPVKPFFQIGDLISGTYEVRGLIGMGAMGQVFEAQDRALNRRVAIKVIASQHGDIAGLRGEAQALAAIRHPAMVTVHTIGVHEGLHYLVMERIYGLSLATHITQRAAAKLQFTLRETLDILVALAEGITAVHRAGVAHRDVKPANVMLAPNNRVVLLDFGINRPESSVQTAEVVGSPSYMAPEAIASNVEPHCWHLVDIYAVGVVAFELLTGQLPYGADTVTEVWKQHLYAPIPDILAMRADTPSRLAQLITNLLQKAPRLRPQEMEFVLWELRFIRNHLGVRERSQREPFSILIVDDDPESNELLKFWVEQTVPEADVRVAFNADQALERIRKKPADLMLLDLCMPDMSGLELCLHLRGTHLADECSIISVSATAGEHDIALLHELGITHFIRKGPELPRKLVATLEALHKARANP